MRLILELLHPSSIFYPGSLSPPPPPRHISDSRLPGPPTKFNTLTLKERLWVRRYQQRLAWKTNTRELRQDVWAMMDQLTSYLRPLPASTEEHENAPRPSTSTSSSPSSLSPSNNAMGTAVHASLALAKRAKGPVQDGLSTAAVLGQEAVPVSRAFVDSFLEGYRAGMDESTSAESQQRLSEQVVGLKRLGENAWGKVAGVSITVDEGYHPMGNGEGKREGKRAESPRGGRSRSKP